MLKTLYRSTIFLAISVGLASCGVHDVLTIPDDTPTMLEIFHGTNTHVRSSQATNLTSMRDFAEDPYPADTQVLHGPVVHVYVFPNHDTQSGFVTPGYWVVVPLLDKVESRNSSLQE